MYRETSMAMGALPAIDYLYDPDDAACFHIA